MSSRRRYVEFAVRARNDFSDILSQSERDWGADQADTYAIKLDNAISDLLNFPLLGRERDDLFPGCRSYLAEQHVIYYDVRDESIHIVRILHQKMNPVDRVTAPENGGPGPHE